MMLTHAERRLMTKTIAMAIRHDDFKVEIHVFSEYARATYPNITNEGIIQLWRIYQSDPTI